MKRLIFADAFYWIALLNQRDDWHQQAVAITSALNKVTLVTTDEVLAEVLNFLSTYGIQMRCRTVRLIKDIIANPNIQVIPQTRNSFTQGLKLYENRLDKEYSLTDCVSMQLMWELGITEVLTHDKHFTQEGFIVLFIDK